MRRRKPLISVDDSMIMAEEATKKLSRTIGYLKSHSAKDLTHDGSKCKNVVRLCGFSDSDWAR